MEETPTGAEPRPRPARPARPVLLTVLCTLTFIGSGMNLISGLLVSVFFDTFTSLMTALSKSMSLPGMDLLLEARPSFFLFNSFCYGLSLTGAWMMVNLKKTGFHLYTIAQILLILAPMYFLKMPGPSVFDLILSGIFVILYALQLKYMS